jgi:hypothetical protein
VRDAVDILRRDEDESHVAPAWRVSRYGRYSSLL